MIFKITYKYDRIPKEFYFETQLTFKKVEELIEKWNCYAYNIDINFCFNSENMSVILNTYNEINFYKSNDLNPYDILDVDLFSYEDGCEIFDLNFDEEDNLRKILINKMIKDFYIKDAEVIL